MARRWMQNTAESFPPRTKSITQRRLQRSPHRVQAALYLFLFVIAVLFRIDGLDRSLWTAEAWVANSATSQNLSEVFYYTGWLQTTPPLFLLLVRIAVQVLQLSNWSLRLAPLMLGVASVVMMAWLSIRVLRPSLAFLCTSLVALSPVAIAYSRELKQYTGDAAATMLLLLLLWRYIERPDHQKYVHLLAGFGFACLLSYSAVMLVPLACIVLFRTGPAETLDGADSRTKMIRFVVFTLLAAIENGLTYVTFVRPNLAPNLYEFWRGNYPDGSGIGTVLMFYTRFFAGMAACFFAPYELETLVSRNLALVLGVLFVLTTFSAALIVYRIVRYGYDRQRIWLAAFAVVPILTLAGLNVVHFYPVSRRLTLFLLPCVCIGVVLLADIVLDAISARYSAPLYRDRIEYSVVLALVGLVGVGSWIDVRANRLTENVEEVVRYLQKTARPDDVVYAHASIIEPTKLYFRMLGWKPPSVIFGDTGYSCCTRRPDPVPGDSAIEDELSRVASQGVGHGIWLVITERNEPWPRLHRDLALRRLRAAGCLQASLPSFAGVGVLHFACRGGVTSTGSVRAAN